MSARRQRQLRRRRNRGNPAIRIVLIVAGVVFALAAGGALGGVAYVLSIANSAPDIDSLKPVDHGANSVVYAADGTRLGFIQNDELRTPVPASEIPRTMRLATVAIEDRRFYQHDGVDLEGVVRAAFKNIGSGSTIQGGSTITMQLVRNLYISNERTFERKIREAKLAEELEDERPKAWILNQYLNTVPYGTNGGQTAIGVQAAARVYFNKPARRLRLHEAALLAGLPQAPSDQNPFKNPDAALERRNEVLRAMADQDMITATQAANAIDRSLGVKPNRYYSRRREQFFFDYVKTELIKEYGAPTVRQGGLKIDTTIDLDLQNKARAAMANVLNQPDDPSSAIVSIDPRNGYIRAMASSAGYGRTKFNYASQGRRQPGSTFKIMVLMAALDRGIDPDKTSYTSKPLNITNSKYGAWKVKTYDNSYRGTISIRKATTTSDNSVYAQMILDLGPEAVRRAAYDMGVTTRLKAYPAEGLGGLEIGVSPLEMANAYATIVSGGMRNTPIAVKRVTFPDGKKERLGRPQRKRTFSQAVAQKAQDILVDNVTGGTGGKAQTPCPTAGKTGTTDSFKDAWFVGFTPRMATSVWVGYPNAAREMRSVHGISVAGGSFPAEIWGKYMTAATRGNCGQFRKSGEPFESRPFQSQFGGRSSGGTEEYGPDGRPLLDTGVDPGAYPQPQTPDTSTPTPRPVPGRGGGGLAPGVGRER